MLVDEAEVVEGGGDVVEVDVDGGVVSVVDGASGSEASVELPVAPLVVAVVALVVVGLEVVTVVDVGRVVLVLTPESSASSVTKRPVWPA